MWPILLSLLASLLAGCDPVWSYRVRNARSPAGQDSTQVLEVAPGITYRVRFDWFAGRLYAKAEVHNGSSSAVRFQPGRFGFKDANGRWYGPETRGAEMVPAGPAEVTPGHSLVIVERTADGPPLEGSMLSRRLAAAAHRITFEEAGILVDGRPVPLRVDLEVQPPH